MFCVPPNSPAIIMSHAVTAHMEHVARNIERGLQDPLRPTFCVSCLGELVLHMCKSDADTQNAFVRLFRRTHQDFFAASMRFITAASSPSAQTGIERLLALSSFACPRRLQGAHGVPFLSGVPKVLIAAPNQLYFAVLRCLHDIPQEKIQSQRFNRHAWPSSPLDVLPGGETTFTALVFWAGTIRESCVAALLSYTLSLCKPEVLGHICTPIPHIVATYLLRYCPGWKAP